MSYIPTGTVTFLFTDIEGSTRLWEQHPDTMRQALARHDELMRRSIQEHGGYIFNYGGDGFCAAFPTANTALNAALSSQLAMAAAPWEMQTPLLVRMALHTGSAEERGGDYFGLPLSRVARLLTAGHGGQILLSLAAQELTRENLPASVTLRDLGTRRLKDLGRPERIFQLLHPDLPAEFPPLRSLDNPDLPNNLPQQLTSFIGREKQVAEVKTLLNKTRLLTLTGTGGSGKTRLSLQVAADLLDQYEDGVWLVELASLSDPALVPQAVAQVLGVQEKAGQTMARALVDALTPKRLLLILDNCEHLPAACAALSADLLRRCPGVQFLASSRQPLNVTGEQTYRVPSLSLPELNSNETAESLSEFEAVRLFIERAQAMQPSFAVTNANAPAVAQVCWRLDGIPLAIELAAARVRVLSVEQVMVRLDDRFRLLTGGARTALPRQQTLRALMDWSYDLLTAQEKLLLARLSVFSGGWTLQEAEAVCVSGGAEDLEDLVEDAVEDVVEDVDVLDLLTGLVDKSLVVYEGQEAEMSRYRLLETIRQYGQERLAESNGAEAVRVRHRDCFLDLAVQASSSLRGPEASAWLSRLEAAHDNLRTALSWCETEAQAEAHLRLAGALWRFWEVRGHYSEGRHCLEIALKRAEMGQASAVWAQALNGAGNLAWRQGDYETARTLLGQSLDMMRRIEDPQGIAHALGNLGAVAWHQGDNEAARTFLEQSLDIKRQLGDLGDIATGLVNLGSVAWNQADYATARTLYSQSLELMRQIGDERGIALALGNLGAVAAEQGDPEAARDFFEQSLPMMRRLGNRLGIATALEGLAGAASARGDYEAAQAFLEQCLDDYRQIGDQRSIASALEGLAGIAAGRGDYSAAHPLFEQCLDIQRQIGNQWGIASALAGMAGVARQQGDQGTARALYVQSLDIRHRIEDKLGIACTLEGLASLAFRQGQPGRAIRLWAAAGTLRGRIGTAQTPQERAQQDPQLEQARAALDEEAFAGAWAAGEAMTLEQALAYALAEEE